MVQQTYNEHKTQKILISIFLWVSAILGLSLVCRINFPLDKFFIINTNTTIILGGNTVLGH